MKTITTFATRYAGLFLAIVLVALIPSFSHATGTFTVTQTVANVTAANDQTDVTNTTVANATQVKSLRVLTVNSVPAASSTDTIGTCVITYSLTVADSLNCSGNAAVINTTTHNSASTIASTIRTMTNVSDANHGGLTIASSSNDASFTPTGAETSTSTIAFSDATSGAVTTSTSTPGVVAAAQINVITVGGTVEPGDIFRITIPTGVVSYTASSGDATLANIANGIDSAILATSTYSSQAFTAATSSNTIVLTAKVAGTGFTQTSATTNRTPVAQQVTFAPPAGVGAATFSITINANTYSYADSTGSSTVIAAGLASAMSADPATTCSATGTAVLCVAKVAGTSFTYSTNVALTVTTPPVTTGNTGQSGGGGGYAPRFVTTTNTHTPTTVVTTTTVPTVIAPVVMPTTMSEMLASGIKTTLHYKSRNSSVRSLQELLASDPTLGFTGTFSGYFGLKTQAALEAFQVKYGVATPGSAGYGIVGPMTRAMLVKVF